LGRGLLWLRTRLGELVICKPKLTKTFGAEDRANHKLRGVIRHSFTIVAGPCAANRLKCVVLLSGVAKETLFRDSSIRSGVQVSCFALSAIGDSFFVQALRPHQASDLREVPCADHPDVANSRCPARWARNRSSCFRVRSPILIRLGCDQ
jgi:hypothetical protein